MAKGKPSVASSVHFIGAHCALIALVFALGIWRFFVTGKPFLPRTPLDRSQCVFPVEQIRMIAIDAGPSWRQDNGSTKATATGNPTAVSSIPSVLPSSIHALRAVTSSS
jgi:hypothetical protein